MYQFCTATSKVLVPRGCRCFSATGGKGRYEDTIGNLKIGSHTRVIYQGFTGKQATANAIQNIEYGTNIVGGVTPNKSGEHLGLPLFPNVKEAAKHLKPDATAVFVAAHHAAKAIEDAIEAEIPLVVAVAEHVPVHDMLRIHSILSTQSKTRLIGPNCPGILNPFSHTRIGFMPHPSFLPGTIGIVSKSGTLSYEAVSSTTRVGLGQSLVISMGGDWIAGTSLKDAVEVFLEDERTEGIVVIGELGGDAELEVAESLKRRNVGAQQKPVMGLIAGLTAPEGRVMGHAGAVTSLGDVTPQEKIRRLEDAGVKMVIHPGQFGAGMLSLLGRKPPAQPVNGMGPGGPISRGFHTLARDPQLRQYPRKIPRVGKREIHIAESAAIKLLKEHSQSVETLPMRPQGTSSFSLAITISRSHRSPCLKFSASSSPSHIVSIPLDYNSPLPSPAQLLSGIKPQELINEAAFEELVNALWKIFKTKEAYLLHLKNIHLSNSAKILIGPGVDFIFDDSAARSAGRQVEIQALPQKIPEDEVELEARKWGIVFIKLKDENANIGCIVNGAGLAMNTNDALVNYHGFPANFLDTGGKATKDTVKESFRLVLRDERVKAVFVNIFGGLTLCDMIAEGIILAFKDLNVEVPVVVRLRGTNEEVGQKMIAESGLPLFAFDDLESAAAKVVALVNRK